MREDIFLSGIGGQGVLLAGQLLLEAALKAGLQGSGMPAYEPEVRGGETTFTVVIADGPPGSPLVGRPHNLVLMDAGSVNRHLSRAADQALVLVNSSLAAAPEPRQGLEVVPVAATDLARDLGSERAANMVMLGALLALRPLFTLDHFIHTMVEGLSERASAYAETNAAALRAGWQAAKDALD